MARHRSHSIEFNRRSCRFEDMLRAEDNGVHNAVRIQCEGGSDQQHAQEQHQHCPTMVFHIMESRMQHSVRSGQPKDPTDAANHSTSKQQGVCRVKDPRA
jgi:hypothetical protein